MTDEAETRDSEATELASASGGARPGRRHGPAASAADVTGPRRQRPAAAGDPPPAAGASDPPAAGRAALRYRP